MEEESTGVQPTTNLTPKMHTRHMECSQCERCFHYRCTGLPVYQIQHFMTRGYRKFVCKKCTAIPDYLKELFDNEVPTTTAPHSAVLSSRIPLSQKTTVMQVIAESNRKLAAKVNERFKDLEKKVVRSKKGNEEHTKLKAEAKILKNGILTYEEQINSLNSTIADRESELKELHENSIDEISADNSGTVARNYDN